MIFLGPGSELMLVSVPWVSITPVPALWTNSRTLTLKQKNFHSAGTWGVCGGVASLPVSDTLLLKGLTCQPHQAWRGERGRVM